MTRLYNGVVRVDAPCPANVLRIDLGAMPMVEEMNRHGILIDKSRFSALDLELAGKELTTQDAIERMVGWRCNPNSGDQVASLLFGGLGLESPLGPKMTRLRRRPAVDDDILASLLSAHPVVPLIRAGRELSKLRGTYTQKLPLMAWPDGRVRTTIRMNVARTGRMASEEPNCFDAETEVLTLDGWVRLPDLAPGSIVAQWDAGAITFVAPTACTHSRRSTMRISNEHIDLCVTPDHRCLLRPRRARGLRVMPASSYPSDYKQINAGLFPGGARQNPLVQGLRADHIRLAIAVQADGSIVPCSEAKHCHGGAIDFTFKKPRKIDRLRGILERLGIEHTEAHNKGGKTRFYVPRRSVPECIPNLLGPHKTFGWWVFDLSRELIDVFVDEIFFWDGLWTRKNNYSSRIKLNADVVQALCVLSGRRTNVRRYVPSCGSESWQTDITRRDYSMTSNVMIERDRLVEDVYCVSVPSSYLLVRRSGKTMVTGNCQNIPIMSEDGARIRGCFVASPGRVLGAIDLSQIEMVWACELSGDTIMLEVFRLKRDLHVRTACSLFRLDYNRILELWTRYKAGELEGPELAEMRDFEMTKRLAAKHLGFGVLFGITPEGLQAGILAAGGPLFTPAECMSYILGWFDLFAGVRDWTRTQYARAQRWGMVWTAFGRWRLVGEAMSAVPRVRSAGLRQAQATPIQGSAGDMLKLGMAEIMPLVYYYRRMFPNCVCLPLLQIHDELLFELSPDIATDFLEEACAILTSAVRPMTVPVRASIAMAEDWGGLK